MTNRGKEVGGGGVGDSAVGTDEGSDVSVGDGEISRGAIRDYTIRCRKVGSEGIG